jgi:mono/diheme cytochrome c family protein
MYNALLQGEAMTSKRKTFAFAAWIAATVLIFICVSRNTSAQAQQANAPKAAAKAGTGNVERGRYIVEDVAYCTNCHTPRMAGGEFDRSHWLQGGPLFWQPAQNLPNFPQQVPRIGGAIPATDAQMVTLLTTGLWTDGKPLRQPMPLFHMTKEDAEAVVAYLKTISTVQ